MSTPNLNQTNNQARGQSRAINIQPSQVTQLLQALKQEVALAKAAGNDTARAQHHSVKAESIKQILLDYQAQQKAKMAQQRGLQQQQSMSQTQQMAGLSRGNQLGMQGNLQSVGNSNFQQQQQPRPQTAPQAQQMGMNTTTSDNQRANSGTPSLPANTITEKNFSEVKLRLEEFERKIHQLENSKKNYTLPEQISQVESSITELKSKYSKYQKFALYMRTQLMERARAQGQSQGSQMGQNQQSTASQNFNQVGQQMVSSQGSVSTPSTAQGQGLPLSQTPPISLPQQVVQNQASHVQASGDKKPQMGKSTSPVPQSQPQSSSASPARINSNLNLQGITKQSAPSLPISSSINVRPPQPVTMKPNNISRPTLSGGVANGFGQILGTPAIVKIPTYELNQSGNAQIPDNGGRVLTKRKLNELVQTIGADQGDGKTVIDGDVEELLLDLADEFINSVTGFACRLAKHRKVESIDVRDVQLHLEKNWNIRIPGYSMDEIKSTRRWQPTPTYQQKVSGVEISKSVNDISG
ncbi:hypothetical protein CANTEDRAFT_130715 [Yamadazyma tenuis ATCC 10573]|uniref:TBP-associated factor 12 n=1 Tax=Candida tenuis (strain ATCC 10573 / BCRC 21748 / CBS 615 / JCM 9827 / NBRC 10315 / NRRL Y-1498 / VKM Y-70) TaxID=590646 RepID=G3B5E9_CANTC|nr:uncharacterized protein CANTEDRAFT_130715 [Yamadazyma tenuis ATCC 10573]EGV63204.1 hypothetical protein CANTEDRAFT_130715 [Yamadazyma tenuis ATCC 10573]